MVIEVRIMVTSVVQVVARRAETTPSSCWASVFSAPFQMMLFTFILLTFPISLTCYIMEHFEYM